MLGNTVGEVSSVWSGRDLAKSLYRMWDTEGILCRGMFLCKGIGGTKGQTGFGECQRFLMWLGCKIWGGK